MLLFFIALIFSLSSAQDVDLKEVRCLVCRSVVDEFIYEVNKIDPEGEIAIGQYRLDAKGNSIQKKVPLSMSEVHLSSLLDSICKSMEDYIRARYKSNGKLTLLKLMSENGVNPLLGQVDIIQDGDLNKSLEYFCTDIVNEHEETFIDVVTKKVDNAKVKICTEAAKYCEHFEEHDDEDVGQGGDETVFDRVSEPVVEVTDDEKSEVKTEL